MPGLPSFNDLFKAFKENVTATVMSLLVIGISIMFTINQKTNEGIKKDLRKDNTKCATEKYVLASQVERYNDKYIEVLAALKELNGEMNTLKKLGIIK